jgi:hypothetical protein
VNRFPQPIYMPPFTCSSCSVMNRLSGDKGPHRRRLGRPNGTATLALRSPIDLRRARIVWVGSSGRARVQDRLRAQPFAQHLTISIAMFFKVSPTAGGQLVNSATEFIKPTCRSHPRLEHLPTGPESSAHGPDASRFIGLISIHPGLAPAYGYFQFYQLCRHLVTTTTDGQPSKITLRKRTLATVK